MPDYTYKQKKYMTIFILVLTLIILIFLFIPFLNQNILFTTDAAISSANPESGQYYKDMSGGWRSTPLMGGSTGGSSAFNMAEAFKAICVGNLVEVFLGIMQFAIIPLSIIFFIHVDLED